jgi:tripartite-type tricarboxylate transporter receptor subunit TctC
MGQKTVLPVGIIPLVIILVFSFTLGSGTMGLAAQQTYPANPIDLVVPFSPGGGTDLIARVFAEALSKKWKKTVNVVNKPGGNCVIGTNYVMQAAPDGYTILLDGGASSSLQIIVADLPYKVEKRTFLAASAAMPGVYVVQTNSPWRNLADVAGAAKKDPGNFTWASLGGTTQADMVLKQFFAAAGVEISKTKAIIFSGGGTGFNAVAGGHVQFGGAGAGSAVPLKGSGLIRCMAVTSSQRLREWPEVPTTKEQGFPSLNTVIWFGFSGPPGLPEPLIRIWDQTTKEIVSDPKVVAQLEKVTSVPMYLGPGEYKKYVLDECEKVKQLLGGK